MRPNCRRLAIQQAVVEALEGRRLLSLAAPVSYTVGSAPQALATGDFNGDGRGDVVTANANSTVAVRLSNPDGTLQSAQSSPTGTNPRAILVGDVNNDGKLDVVTANGGGNLSRRRASCCRPNCRAATPVQLRWRRCRFRSRSAT
jgi:hypothetical protein